MAELHRLLQRQLKRHFGAQYCVPPEWLGVLADVSDEYHDIETSQELLKRSLVLSSQELHHANAEMRAVFQAIPDLLFRLDAHGVILDFKAGSSADLLFPGESYLQKRFQNVLPKSLGQRFEEAIERVLATKNWTILEYTLTLQGQERCFEVRFVPLLDDQIVAMVRNITERKRAEAELEMAHLQLLENSRQDGASEVATSVLHNIGNVLNSVNVSSTVLVEQFQSSRLPTLNKAVDLMQAHAHDLPAFMATNAQGNKLLPFLVALADHLALEQEEACRELALLSGHVDRIKEILALQQKYARAASVREHVAVVELLEYALHMMGGTLESHQIKLVREFTAVPLLLLEKHKILQILLNLLHNADHACCESNRPDKQITLQVTATGHHVRLSITDNGVGIPGENLTRIFNQGFTTRHGERGFSLHSGALAATAMGGSLTAHSTGLGQGANFILELPLKPNVEV